MRDILGLYKDNLLFVLGIFLLLVSSVLILRSVAPTIFPGYYLYIVIALTAFIVFSQLDFNVLSAFSTHFYIFSIVFLLVPLFLGQIRGGAARWIGFGDQTLQPSELVKPFIILFLANYLAKNKNEPLQFKKALRGALLFFIPFLLILIQPSLGVSVLLTAGFFGVILSLNYNKKVLIYAPIFAIVALPITWFVLAPYQKARVLGLFSPDIDPTGAGYNSIQSKITIGSGRFFGRGLGSGVQTQLLFLPERHTDFIFASISEEMGFVGAVLVVSIIFFVLYRIVKMIDESESFVSRAFISGIFLSLFLQVVTHIGMNMGILPITGLPLPIVSAGGSSLLSTMIMLGMVISAKKA